jgi:peptide/nickel transport system substrate-binding protein
MKKIFKGMAAAVLIATPFVAQAAGDSVTIGMRAEPPGLDPTTGAAAAISQITQYNIFETLTRIDNSGAVHPMLAESWTISDDALTYTFNLVKGAKFHDGTNFNAWDVKYTFDRNAAKDSQNKRKKIFQNMASVSVPDNNTVVVVLRKRNGFLTFNLAQATGAIVGKESAAKNATRPIGTGPYKFVSWTKGDNVEMTAFKAHRDADKLAIKHATFRFIKDAAAQVASLLAGDLDYMPSLSAPELYADLKQHPDFVGLQGNTEGETILSTNNKHPVMKDIRMRKAVMHAIDRSAVAEAASAGYGTPIGSHFPPHHPAYVDLTGMHPFDVAKAKALMKEAGYNGEEIMMRLPPFDYAKRGGEVINDMLKTAGFNVKMEVVEWPVWLDKVYKNRQYALTIVSHVEPMDMGIYARDDYYFQYESAEFEEIWSQVEQATSQADQYKYLKLAQQKLAEDAVNGYLYQGTKLGLARKGLNGLWNNWPAFINKVSDMSWSM